MGVFRSLSGVLEAELVSAEPDKAVSDLAEGGIEVYRVRKTDSLCVRFQVCRRDQKKLERFAQKRGDRLRILGHRGAYWSLIGLVKRPVLILGVLSVLLMTLLIPRRIFLIRVEGNVTVSKRQILSAAEAGGVGFGVLRRQIRSEQVKNAMLEAIPRLQWVGVNTAGCVAVITVQEKRPEEKGYGEGPAGHIVAARDGVIVSCTGAEGEVLCKAGQAVKKGDILISGLVDLGSHVRLTQAQGEIYAQTLRRLEAVMPTEYTVQTLLESCEKKYALIIGKKRINFYKDSGILGATCDKMTTVEYMTLPGGFCLPIGLVTEQWSSYQVSDRQMSKENAEILLEDFALDLVKQQMVAGRVLRFNGRIQESDGAVCLFGSYACIEMIGRPESVGFTEDHGEID